MRVTIAVLSATLLFFGGASIAAAKTPSHRLVGEIASVDATAKTLSVREQPKSAHPKEMKFSLASDAKIMAGASAENLGQLKIGDPVTVTYVSNGDTHTATRIELAKVGGDHAGEEEPVLAIAEDPPRCPGRLAGCGGRGGIPLAAPPFGQPRGRSRSRHAEEGFEMVSVKLKRGRLGA